MFTLDIYFFLTLLRASVYMRMVLTDWISCRRHINSLFLRKLVCMCSLVDMGLFILLRMGLSFQRTLCICFVQQKCCMLFLKQIYQSYKCCKSFFNLHVQLMFQKLTHHLLVYNCYQCQGIWTAETLSSGNFVLTIYGPPKFYEMHVNKIGQKVLFSLIA